MLTDLEVLKNISFRFCSNKADVSHGDWGLQSLWWIYRFNILGQPLSSLVAVLCECFLRWPDQQTAETLINIKHVSSWGKLAADMHEQVFRFYTRCSVKVLQWCEWKSWTAFTKQHFSFFLTNTQRKLDYPRPTELHLLGINAMIWDRNNKSVCNEGKSREKNAEANISEQILIWRSSASATPRRSASVCRAERVSLEERGRCNKVIPREILPAVCLLAADSVSDFAGDWWCLAVIREVIHQGFIAGVQVFVTHTYSFLIRHRFLPEPSYLLRSSPVWLVSVKKLN